MSVAASSTAQTFVLVHGAWRGGWCYGRVADLLRARGRRVFTPTLSGLGERSHNAADRAIDLAAHIRDVVDVIHWESQSQVILCGHSYGGMVITGVADAIPDRVAALVYLDAMLPQNGKSVLDINRAPPVVEMVLNSAAENGGFLVPALPAALFNTNAADQAWVDALATPQPLATFCQKMALRGGHLGVAHKTYVRATGWGGYETLGFHAFDQVKDDPRWRRIDVPAGHELMIDAPQAVADILLGVGEQP